MTQRTRKESVIIDDALRQYFSGEQTVWRTSIKRALAKSDLLTQQLVELRARGVDWRKITLQKHISATTYYSRLRLFRATLLLVIQNP